MGALWTARHKNAQELPLTVAQNARRVLNGRIDGLKLLPGRPLKTVKIGSSLDRAVISHTDVENRCICQVELNWRMGPDHPHTATALNNLAELLCSKEDYEGAEPLYRRALAIIEETLGPDHSTTQTIRKSLDEVLKKLGK